MAKSVKVRFDGKTFPADPGQWVEVSEGIRMRMTNDVRECQLTCTECGQWYDTNSDRCHAYNEFRKTRHYLCLACTAKYVEWAKAKLAEVVEAIQGYSSVIAEVLGVEYEDGLMAKLAIQLHLGSSIYPQEKVMASLLLNSPSDAQRLARLLGTDWQIFDKRPGWMVQCPAVVLEYNPSNLGPVPEGSKGYRLTCLDAQDLLEYIIRQHGQAAEMPAEEQPAS